jgi:hypothetical protein
LSPARRQISTSQASDFRSIVSVKHLCDTELLKQQQLMFLFEEREL